MCLSHVSIDLSFFAYVSLQSVFAFFFVNVICVRVVSAHCTYLSIMLFCARFYFESHLQLAFGSSVITAVFVVVL